MSDVTSEASTRASADTNLQNQVNSLNSSVSNGKNQVANAITGKGVAASGSDSFATLASKIGQIPSSPFQNSSYVSQVIEKTTYNPTGISVANHDRFKIISAPPVLFTYNNRLYEYAYLDSMGGNTDYNRLRWRDSSYDRILGYSLGASYDRVTNTLTWRHDNGEGCFASTELSLLSDGRIRITINLQNVGYYQFQGELKAILESTQPSFAMLTKVSDFYNENSIYLWYNTVKLAVQ